MAKGFHSVRTSRLAAVRLGAVVCLVAGIATVLVKVTEPSPSRQTPSVQPQAFVPPTVQPPPKPIHADIECGDDFDYPPMGTTLYGLPPRNCWTHWLVRDRQSRSFSLHVPGVVDFDVRFANGTHKLYLNQSPLDETYLSDVPTRVTGFRYRNRGNKALTLEFKQEN